MLDGNVAEGDNDMQCVKPKYVTRQVACSGSVGNSLEQGTSEECLLTRQPSHFSYLLRESFSGMMVVVSLRLFKKLVTS